MIFVVLAAARVVPCGVGGRSKNCCGDGACTGPEDIINCLADCPGVTTDAQCGEEQHSDRGGGRNRTIIGLASGAGVLRSVPRPQGLQQLDVLRASRLLRARHRLEPHLRRVLAAAARGPGEADVWPARLVRAVVPHEDAAHAEAVQEHRHAGRAVAELELSADARAVDVGLDQRARRPDAQVADERRMGQHADPRARRRRHADRIELHAEQRPGVRPEGARPRRIAVSQKKCVLSRQVLARVDDQRDRAVVDERHVHHFAEDARLHAIHVVFGRAQRREGVKARARLLDFIASL